MCQFFLLNAQAVEEEEKRIKCVTNKDSWNKVLPGGVIYEHRLL